MPDENITIYKGKKKEVLATSHPGHIDKEYELIEDLVHLDGTRHIVLKPKDMTELNRIKNELVDKIAEKIGESESKTLKKLFLDALGDYRTLDIVKMHKKVVLGIEPVKATRGCFEIIIGDGRRKGADFIRIRE